MIYLPEISAIAQSMIPYKTCIVCYKAYRHFFISVSAAGLYATNIIPACFLSWLQFFLEFKFKK